MGIKQCVRCARRSTSEIIFDYAGHQYQLLHCAHHRQDFDLALSGWQAVAWEELPATAPEDCDRCPIPATASADYAVNGKFRFLFLCERHSEAFSRDIRAWVLRDGILMEESVIKPLVKVSTAPPRRIVLDRPPVEEESVVEPLPLNVLDWHMTEHCQRRLAERGPRFGFTRQDVYRALATPADTHETNMGRHRMFRRGPVTVIANELTMEVLTVGPNLPDVDGVWFDTLTREESEDVERHHTSTV